MKIVDNTPAFAPSNETLMTSAEITHSPSRPVKLVLPIITAVSFVHLLNDLIQAILPAIYPLLKIQYALSFTQLGLITLIFQITASLLQPAVGFYTDKYPKPLLLPLGMTFTLLGLLLLAVVNSFPLLWLQTPTLFKGAGLTAGNFYLKVGIKADLKTATDVRLDLPDILGINNPAAIGPKKGVCR